MLAKLARAQCFHSLDDDGTPRGADAARMFNHSRETTMRNVLLLLACIAPLAAAAQTAPFPTEFPSGAVEMPPDDLKARLADKVFRVTRADGNHWRIQFKDNGYVFINTSSGLADDGRWRVEGSKLCSDVRRGTSGCAEVRVVGEQLYLKRSVNGEIVRYELQ